MEIAKFQRCVTPSELPRESVKLRGIEEIGDWTGREGGLKSFYRCEIKLHKASRFVSTRQLLFNRRTFKHVFQNNAAALRLWRKNYHYRSVIFWVHSCTSSFNRALTSTFYGGDYLHESATQKKPGACEMPVRINIGGARTVSVAII